MAGERILIVDDSRESRAWLIDSVARPAGYTTAEAATLPEARAQIATFHPDAIILDAQLGFANGLELLREYDSKMPIIVTTPRRAIDEVLEALRGGARDVLVKPIEPDILSASIARVLSDARVVRERDALRETLRERVECQALEFDVLYNIGKTITALHNTEEILTNVVSAAVSLLRADEGSLLLIDPDSGLLYLRANKNLDEAAAQNLRIRIEDSLMGRVIQSGKPVIVSGDAVVKLKTSFLVKSILCVPLTVGRQVIGVLSVDHKTSTRAFSEHDVHLLSTLADYAAIAIENSRLYWAAEDERARLDAILRDTQDAVLVVDPDTRIVLANNAARGAFGLSDQAIGQRLSDVVHNSALLDLFDQRKLRGHTWRAEIPLPDGRTLQGQLSELTGVGYGAVMQDITRLKELDRIKSEFISIVSHDLRTPLTTIRGYIELLPRAGPLNEMQQDFVDRVERGTNNIASLITDLLDVSRIEAGLDWEMESTDLSEVVHEAAESLREDAETKDQQLIIEVPGPSVMLGNSRRLAQVVTNLVGNAIKYTPDSGRITVSLRDNREFLLLEVRDTGIGIAPEDQMRIFDKFYRVESEATIAIVGTGLGLSIVKSIVEKHKGRVWVESEAGKGSTFSVLLPRYGD